MQAEKKNIEQNPNLKPQDKFVSPNIACNKKRKHHGCEPFK